MAQHRKRLLQNFISLSIVQGLVMVFPLLLFPYLIRVLGLEQFGVFTLVQTLMMYFDLFVSFGFGLIATQHVARNLHHPGIIREVVTSVFFIKSLLFLFPLLLMLGLLLWWPGGGHYGEYVLAASLFVVGNILFPDWYFQGIQRMQSITVVALVSKVVSLALILLWVKAPSDTGQAVLAISLGNFIAGLLGFYLLSRQCPISFHRPPRRFLVPFFRKSGAVFSSMVLVPLYSSMNIFILQYFTNPLMVGYYALSEKVFSAISMITSVANRTLFPHLSQLYTSAPQAYQRQVLRMSGFFLLSFGVMSLGLYFFSDWIIRLLAGTRQVTDIGYAADLLRIMCVAMVGAPFGSFFYQLMILQGQRLSAIRNILALVLINIFTASVLSYGYGARGMAYNLCLIVFLIALFNLISLGKKWRRGVIFPVRQYAE